MGTALRRKREKQDLRTKILDAARELFAAHGYEAVTMRKVADRIAYSPTAIYLHFTDKEALIRELCAADWLALAGRFQPIAVVRDPVERLKQIATAYIEFALQHPNHYRLMFMTPTPITPEDIDSLGVERGNPAEDSYAFLRQTVAEALAAGRFRAGLDDPDLISQTLWAGVHGVASLEIALGKDPWVEWRPLGRRSTDMLEALFSGFLRKD